MIAYIQGNLTHNSPMQVILDAGGLGYEVHISLSTYNDVKTLTNCKLFTYLHITQDAHILYGFSTLEEKEWFLHLLSVNGIGPRMGITILSYLTPIALQEIILAQRITSLQTIKGIGQKVAQRILLELKDKAAKMGALMKGKESIEGQVPVYESALAGLMKLGIQKAVAEKTLAGLSKTYVGELTVETLIKLALKG